MIRIASILAVTAAAFAVNAHAETPGTDHTFVPQKTRAEVQADLLAYKAGGVNPWSTQYNPLRGFKSSASRAAVTADYIANRDAVAAIGAEGGGDSAFAGAPRKFHVSDTLAVNGK
jgi:hypothetical protein